MKERKQRSFLIVYSRKINIVDIISKWEQTIKAILVQFFMYLELIIWIFSIFSLTTSDAALCCL